MLCTDREVWPVTAVVESPTVQERARDIRHHDTRVHTHTLTIFTRLQVLLKVGCPFRVIVKTIKDCRI